MVTTMDEEGVSKVWQWEVDPLTREVEYNSPKMGSLRDYLQGNTLVFHHAKYDLRALAKVGLIIHSSFPKFSSVPPTDRDILYWPCDVPIIHDTLLLSHVCNSQGADGRHGLKDLALYYLDIPEDDEKALRASVVASRRIGKKLGWKIGKDLHGEPSPGMDYWMPRAVYNFMGTPGSGETIEVPAEWATLCEEYAIQDVHRTIGLYFFLNHVLEQDGLFHAYEREMRLLPATYMMEHVGMHVHLNELNNTLKEFKYSAQDYKAKAEELLQPFSKVQKINANSTKQLASALLAAGVPLTKRTAPSCTAPHGNWAMDAPTLREIAQAGELAGVTSAIRQTASALRYMVGWHPDTDTDIDTAIPGYKTFKTGVSYCSNYHDLLTDNSLLHPSYMQTGTAWTRYSCTEPNGQNISTKAVLPLRRMFGPPPGYVWLCVDYAQLELRIFAYASNDKKLIDALSGGKDFHAETACQLYELPPEKISKEQRTIAKNVNFGIIYGAGPGKVDATTGKPGTYQLYMRKFPDARKFMQGAIARVEDTGYTHTLFNYRLYVKPDKTYAVVNGIVQGTAGDIVKNAMIEIYERGLVDFESPSKELPYGGSAMIANIHDEIVFQFPESYPYRAIGKRVMQIMEQAGEKLGIITPVDAKLVKSNWAEGEKF